MPRILRLVEALVHGIEVRLVSTQADKNPVRLGDQIEQFLIASRLMRI
jgi:hypothetical protein